MPGMLLQASPQRGKPPWLFLCCVFLWAGTTAGVCGGWCQALLKLALPHLGCVCLCSCTHKGPWQTVAAVTWRKHQARSATLQINLCRLHRCSPPASVWATALNTMKKELSQKNENKKKLKKGIKYVSPSGSSWVSPPTPKKANVLLL